MPSCEAAVRLSRGLRQPEKDDSTFSLLTELHDGRLSPDLFLLFFGHICSRFRLRWD